MADSTGQMSQEAAMAKVASGFNGGKQFDNANLAPSMTVVDGYPAEVTKKVQGGVFPQPTPDNTWFNRKGGK